MLYTFKGKKKLWNCLHFFIKFAALGLLHGKSSYATYTEWSLRDASTFYTMHQIQEHSQFHLKENCDLVPVTQQLLKTSPHSPKSFTNYSTVGGKSVVQPTDRIFKNFLFRTIDDSLSESVVSRSLNPLVPSWRMAQRWLGKHIQHMKYNNNLNFISRRIVNSSPDLHNRCWKRPHSLQNLSQITLQSVAKSLYSRPMAF